MKALDIDVIYPLIDTGVKKALGKQVKKEILPGLKVKVREELMAEVTE